MPENPEEAFLTLFLSLVVQRNADSPACPTSALGKEELRPLNILPQFPTVTPLVDVKLQLKWILNGIVKSVFQGNIALGRSEWACKDFFSHLFVELVDCFAIPGPSS